MSGPPFTMSKYASEADLLRDKCAWLEGQLAEKNKSFSETVKWVPVEERMPDAYQGVLVATLSGIVPRAVMVWGGGRWTIGVSDTRYDAPITHWMPLPEPPK